MNRRLAILYYWLFRDKNNVAASELFKFLRKPRVKVIASRYVQNISFRDNYIEAEFNTMKNKLYWPQQYGMQGLYQVSAETFDIYDWHRYECSFTKVSQNDIVIDVGSAEGLFALSIIDKCAKVILIEPNTIFFHALKKTFNDYIPRKVECHNIAVGDKVSNASFRGNVLSGQVIESNDGDVKMTTLDDIFVNTDRIDYIKADLEGYEMKMLKGASRVIRKHRPKIAITCYHKANDYKEMIRFIKALVPEYNFYVKGISQYEGKPVMIHFWVS